MNEVPSPEFFRVFGEVVSKLKLMRPPYMTPGKVYHKYDYISIIHQAVRDYPKHREYLVEKLKQLRIS